MPDGALVVGSTDQFQPENVSSLSTEGEANTDMHSYRSSGDVPVAFPNVSAARAMAIRILSRVISADIEAGTFSTGRAIEILNEDGIVLAVVTVADAVEEAYGSERVTTSFE